MHPLNPATAPHRLEPNLELLRVHGWSVNSIYGPYCVAWRGKEEIVLVWRNAGWQRIGGTAGASL